MLHIITVHWQDDSWVDIQLTYLNTYILEPFKIYAFLNGLPRDHGTKYFYSSSEPIEAHAIKLNILADIAAFNTTGDDDLLMFLDGDAFPIGDIISFGREKLTQYPIIAVQRLENCNDIQPHPCFCLTTVKFWKEIKGDWKHGYQWRNSEGEMITDVGGNLLGILREKGIDWYPILRSNKKNLHPVLFALYDNLIYHHGAGFRSSLTRADVALDNELKTQELKIGLLKRWERSLRKRVIKPLKNYVMGSKSLSHKKKLDPLKEIEKRNSVLSQQVFEMIKKDSNFSFSQFIDLGQVQERHDFI